MVRRRGKTRRKTRRRVRKRDVESEEFQGAEDEIAEDEVSESGRKRRSKKVEKIDMVVVTPKISRVAHWGTAIAFFFTALTGLFHYYRVPLVPQPLGGVYALGWIHFGFGAAFFAGIVLVFLIWGLRSLAFRGVDLVWWGQLGGFAKKFAKPPEAYRYNGGQKAFTILICLVSLILFLTGVFMKFWFVVMPNGHGLANTASMFHVFMVTTILALLLLHIYFSTIATPGRFGAMWGGRVPKKFMELHHSLYDLEKISLGEEARRKRRAEEMERRKSRMKSARASGRISGKGKLKSSKQIKLKSGKKGFRKPEPEESELPVDEETAAPVPVEEEAPAVESAVDAGGMDFDESEFEDADASDIGAGIEDEEYMEDDEMGDEMDDEMDEEISVEAEEVEAEIEDDEPDAEPRQ
ncbi:MAG: formate dehydrogenase subunit gamma [Planctomycetota bacterium]|jgi:formate dehydrogenase gamma subunit